MSLSGGHSGSDPRIFAIKHRVALQLIWLGVSPTTRLRLLDIKNKHYFTMSPPFPFILYRKVPRNDSICQCSERLTYIDLNFLKKDIFELNYYQFIAIRLRSWYKLYVIHFTLEVTLRVSQSALRYSKNWNKIWPRIKPNCEQSSWSVRTLVWKFTKKSILHIMWFVILE